mmetsp:Transcript_36226/g.94941  ORF Transcript_36226/g.94941 Transcript_36226/m.94941 type:complete len:299 (+) Transcript_36226:2141-3037(+)
MPVFQARPRAKTDRKISRNRGVHCDARPGTGIHGGHGRARATDVLIRTRQATTDGGGHPRRACFPLGDKLDPLAIRRGHAHPFNCQVERYSMRHSLRAEILQDGVNISRRPRHVVHQWVAHTRLQAVRVRLRRWHRAVAQNTVGDAIARDLPVFPRKVVMVPVGAPQIIIPDWRRQQIAHRVSLDRTSPVTIHASRSFLPIECPSPTAQMPGVQTELLAPACAWNSRELTQGFAQCSLVGADMRQPTTQWDAGAFRRRGRGGVAVAGVFAVPPLLCPSRLHTCGASAYVVRSTTELRR